MDYESNQREKSTANGNYACTPGEAGAKEIAAALKTNNTLQTLR